MDNKIKITFISPYDINVASGLRFLSAYLKQHGHQADIIFMSQKESSGQFDGLFNKSFYSDKAVQDLVEHCRDSDLVGFSLMTNYFLKVKELTEKIKSELDVPVIWGGIHATVRPEECIRYADMICIGEGEEAVLELAESFKSGDFHSIPNLWIKNGDRIIKNPPRPLEKDLDKYPFQDYDLSTQYVLRNDAIVPMDDVLLKEIMPKDYEGDKPRIMYHLITARNCPHNCTYCCNNALRQVYSEEKNFVRTRSVENVIGEMEYILNRFPFFSVISIFDDTFFIRSREDIRKFSRLYKEKINLPLMCSVSPHTLDEEKLKSLVNAGLYRTSVGFQSMSTDTLLGIYKRPTPQKVIDKTIRTLKKFQKEIPRPVYHFIIDNPYETNASLKTSIEFILTLPARSRIYLYPLVFFPGTEIYRRAKKDGIIKDEIREIYLKSWTIDDVQNLNFLTTLFYFAVWSKFHPAVMKPMNRIIRFLMKDRVVAVMDNKASVKMMVLLLKAYIFSIQTLGKLRK